ncbi:succinyldiaminopimelate transaminase [Mariniluteicoccus flavus]
MTSSSLPQIPWLAAKALLGVAEASGQEVIDLTIGSPVDPTPQLVIDALVEGGNAPGYPAVTGTPALNQAIRGYLARRFDVEVTAEQVLPVVGTKEFIATAPAILATSTDAVSWPITAYPTYGVGAQFSHLDSGPAIEWLNWPANPSGAMVTADEFRAEVDRVRSADGVVLSDECYLEFCWEGEPISVLDERVSGGDLTNVLAVNSLSKRSNMAGYRAGFIAGDPNLVSTLIEWRRQLGLIMPLPIQAAMIAALGDDAHVDEQRDRYRRRRQLIADAVTAAGFRIDHSQGGLYLWIARPGSSDQELARWFAERGIIVTPGRLYGDDDTHVRIALTCTDAKAEAAAARISEA